MVLILVGRFPYLIIIVQPMMETVELSVEDVQIGMIMDVRDMLSTRKRQPQLIVSLKDTTDAKHLPSHLVCVSKNELISSIFLCLLFI